MIAIFGSPGAGKTVQGRKFARKYNWEWVSNREFFVKMRDKDIALALNHGMPIENAKNIEILSQIMKEREQLNDWRVVLDGFPTSVSEIYWMLEHDYLKHLEGGVILRVPRGELWMRLLKRGRADDTRAAIERRQDAYERSITGIWHVLKENGIRVEEINGSNSENDVYERLEEKLKDWGIV